MADFRSVFVLLVCVLAHSVAWAHDPGLSSAQIIRTNGSLEVHLAFARSDFASMNAATIDSDEPGIAQRDALERAMAQSAVKPVRIYAGKIPLRATDPVIAPGTTNATEVLILMRWTQVPPGDLRVEFPVLLGMPFGHRMMLTVDHAAEPAGLLNARHRTWDLPSQPDAAASGSAISLLVQPAWSSFVVLGVEHILTGFDHLCFLLALLLVASRFRDVLTVITTFTVAHSLTLAAAAFGAFNLSSAIVEPLIAASIVYIGLENLFLRRQPRHRLALVFGFGLVHGLGFASALAERLPGVTGFTVVPPLLGFNAGVELGQLAVAAFLVPMIRLARARPAFSVRMQPACSLLIAMAGFVWLLQRV